MKKLKEILHLDNKQLIEHCLMESLEYYQKLARKKQDVEEYRQMTANLKDALEEFKKKP